MVDLPTYYAVGTVSVANGATIVNGSGTGWSGTVYAGDLFMDPAQPLVPPQRISTVTDSTHLTLAVAWPGTSMTSDPYEVRLTPDGVRIQERTRQVLNALGALVAADVPFTPAGSIAADDLQAAIEELDAEKQPLDADLTALASAFTAAGSGAQAKLALAEQTTNGANTVTVQAPAAVTSNRTFTLPDATVTMVEFIAALLNSTSLSDAQAAIGVRERLTANRTYYVGYNIPTPTISIATPAVVTSTAHSLSAGAAVVFSVPPNNKAGTISAASPAVITMANSFAAGQPVKFSSIGSLPIPLVQGTTYYVIATGLSGSSFQVSATVGGAAINTTPPTATFTNGSANIGITNANTYLAVGNVVRFATTGGLPTNFATGTDYYVVSASSTLITVSATLGGSAIVAGSAGTGTQTVLQAGTHSVLSAGVLPTGITEGTTYYVISSGLGTNSFQVSTTVGGSAVNTSGSVTGSPVYSAYTGSNSNTGLANTSGGAFLTAQKAMDVIASTLDIADYDVTVSIANGAYTSTLRLKTFIGSAGRVKFIGNTTTPANVLFSTTGASAVATLDTGVSGIFELRGFKPQTTTSGDGISINAPRAAVDIGNIDFGTCAGTQLNASYKAFVRYIAQLAVSGNAVIGFCADRDAMVFLSGGTIIYSNSPAYSARNFQFTGGGTLDVWGMTFTNGGTVTGKRYEGDGLGRCFTNGSNPLTYVPGSSDGTTATGAVYH